VLLHHLGYVPLVNENRLGIQIYEKY